MAEARTAAGRFRPMQVNRRARGRLLVVVLAAAALLAGPVRAGAATPAPRVLHVGSYHGMPGTFSTIGDAVRAAQPGDWILVGPGDYHERMDHDTPSPTEAEGGVEITTPGLHLRGMDRNAVIVDGTKPGSPACSSAPADQDLGPLNASSVPVGRNGVVVDKADDTTVDNLTVCNFLRVNGGDGGNEIWWNGGDGTGIQGMNGFEGSYLSATDTYYDPSVGRTEYGIFVSNVKGPGSVSHTYANNMQDGAYYIGACPDCNTVLDDAHGQGSQLGYSGTNSGGRLIIQNSEFDHNNTGFTTNSQNNDDAPSPQDGKCPPGIVGPTGTKSCWVFRNNYVHDNNNPNVPGTGTDELGPPGAGVVLAGGRHDTIINNRFERNGSWAVLIAPYLDTGTPPPIAHCQGGIPNFPAAGNCYYASFGNEVSGNTFTDNGGFGNETNGDIGDLMSANPANCYHGNVDTSGTLTSAPADIQTTNGSCTVNGTTAPLFSPLYKQAVCAQQLNGPCPSKPGMDYPRRTSVDLMPLPAQAGMPDPCAGVPDDAWCPAPPTTTTTVTPTTSSTAPGTPAGQVVAPEAAPAAVVRARPAFAG